MVIDSKEVGKRIRSIRNQLGMTTDEFGDLFNPPASKGTVSKWENGHYLPNNERLKVISDISVPKVSVDELLYGNYSTNQVNMLISENNIDFKNQFSNKICDFILEGYKISGDLEQHKYLWKLHSTMVHETAKINNVQNDDEKFKIAKALYSKLTDDIFEIYKDKIHEYGENNYFAKYIKNFVNNDSNSLGFISDLLIYLLEQYTKDFPGAIGFTLNDKLELFKSDINEYLKNSNYDSHNPNEINYKLPKDMVSKNIKYRDYAYIIDQLNNISDYIEDNIN